MLSIRGDPSLSPTPGMICASHLCIPPSTHIIPLPAPWCNHVLVTLQTTLLVPHWMSPYAVCVLYFKLSRQAERIIKCEVF